jgi:DNA polymerase I-like protein with 3'-5' exonuclease and polymerase domains
MKRYIIQTLEDCKKFFKYFNTEVFAFDTETTSLKYRELDIEGISFCDGNLSCYINFIDNPDKEYIIEYLQEVFDNAVILIGHNIVFDLKVLHKKSISIQDRVQLYDTMIADHLIDENRRHGLKFLAELLLGKNTTKWKEIEDHKSKEFFSYACNDAIWTYELMQYQKPILIEQNLVKLMKDIEMPFQWVLLDMAINGMLVDKEKIKVVGKVIEEDLKVLYAKLLEYNDGQDMNFNSSKQLCELLFEKYKLPILEKTPSGKPSVGSKTMENLKGLHPIIEVLSEYKRAQKLLSSYFSDDAQILQNIDDDDRVRPSFMDTGTATGRLSCIAEGTKIQVLRDFSKYPEGINIEDVKEGDLVYSSDRYGSLVTRKVKRLINNGIQECIKLKWYSLSNKFDGELICTPDHKIKTLDGKWTRADKVGLTSKSEIGYRRRMGDDISKYKRAYSLHFQLNDYAYIYYPGMKKVKNIRYIMGAPNIQQGSHIHHKDENKLNDALENLVVMTSTEHTRLHAYKTGFNPESQLKAQKVLANMRKLGVINYNKDITEWSYEYCLGLAHKHKGMIKYIIQEEHHDFETIKREMKRNNIDLKEIKKLYEKTNHYFVGREKVGLRQVYDLEIEGDMYDTHNFFANEICVHNCNSPNLQQLPRPDKDPYDTRSVFIVPEGKTMITCDYSGQELRVLTEITKEAVLIDTFNKGKDMHLSTANDFFDLGIPEEALYEGSPLHDEYKNRYKTERTQAKIINFGMAYGKGAFGFSKDFNIPEEEAQKILDKYFAALPGVKESIDRCHAMVRSHGYVTTMTGRRRRFQKNCMGYYPNGAYRQSFNFLIQGFSADMIRMAMIKVRQLGKEHPEWGLRTIACVHDEIVVEVKKEYTTDASQLIKHAMETAVEFCIPIIADVNNGDNYYDAK